MAGLPVYTVVSSGRFAGNVRRNGKDLLRIELIVDEGTNWTYHLDYLPWSRLLVTIKSPTNRVIRYYRVDLAREAKPSERRFDVVYLDREHPLVEAMNPADNGVITLTSTDGSGRFVGQRVIFGIIDNTIHDFNRDDWVAGPSVDHLALSSYGHLTQDGSTVSLGSGRYIIVGQDERVLGATTSHVVTRGPAGITIYPLVEATTHFDAPLTRGGQVISRNPGWAGNVYVLSRQIIWQDLGGIRAYEHNGTRVLMPPHQADQVRLADVQPFPGRDGFLYQVQLPSGQYAVISGDQVVAKGAERMVLSERVRYDQLLATILPGPLVRYLQRAI